MDASRNRFMAPGGLPSAQDLHHVLARLLLHDQKACRMMDGDSSPILS
jgi:hypothetical protein